MRSLEDELRARSATESDFMVGDVLVAAARSMRDRFGTHLGFAMVFLGWMGMIGCVLTAALMVFVLTSMRLDADHLDQQAARLGKVAVVGGAVLVGGMWVTAAIHRGVSIAVSLGDLRGEEVGLRAGLRAMARRFFTLLGLGGARLGLDAVVGVPIALGLLYLVMQSELGRSAEYIGTHPFGDIAITGPGFVVGYFVFGAWAAFVRARVGLAPSIAHAESLGPVEAMRRSARLLAGRRVHFVGMRVLWWAAAFVIVLVLYAPLWLLGVMSESVSGAARGFFTLLQLPYLALFTIFVSLVHAFDSSLEAAYYTHLVPREERPKSVAEVFA